MKKFGFLAALPLAWAMAIPAAADALPEKAGAERSVAMFNLFCLSRMPDIGDVARVAKAGEFTELQGDDLKPFQPEAPAEELRAWRYKDFEQEFALVTTRSKPDEEFKKQVPDFANSTSFACSLVLPAKDASDDLLKGVETVMERKADENFDEGPFKVHSWSGQNDELMVNVLYYAPDKEKAGGLMSTVTFVKN
ncbi:MAG: hypothetical protein VX871_07590 [Pseudomonadota bacterium]|nr:hypothetical protein [Pseudomonadota bacterium]